MKARFLSPRSKDLSRFRRLFLRAGRWLGDRTLGPTHPPPGVEPVTGFDTTRFLGTWYEVMRLDHGFERSLTNVTATYGLLDGGRLSVTNVGFDPAADRWHEIHGTARFRDDPLTGSLVVTFFWPLRGGLHVIDLDWAYTHALLAGPSRKYLWLLSRDPDLSEDVREQMLDAARQAGFQTEKLIPVLHDRDRPNRWSEVL